jgi:hypothetical protein
MTPPRVHLPLAPVVTEEDEKVRATRYPVLILQERIDAGADRGVLDDENVSLLFDGDDSATAASVSSTAAGSGSGLKRRTTPRPARRLASLPPSVSGTAPISPKRRSSSR